MKKRLWYLILCILFLSTLMPVTALGADAGDFVVTGGVLGTDFTYAANVLTFIQPGTYTVSMNGTGLTKFDRIQIDAGTSANPVNLILDNVGIYGTIYDYCPLALQNTSYVNLTLEGTSTLISGTSYAGIFCPQGASITILGSGSLLAQGGQSGAGIGGDNAQPDSGAITITGGKVTAIGGAYSAGIGGGDSGDEGTISISGGTVFATGGREGAGIGGGIFGTGGTVYISGGSVLATAGDGSGENIGAGDHGYVSGTLTNGSGSGVYLTTVTLDGVDPGTAIHSLTTSTTYGINGMQTHTGGQLYLYLPESTHTTAAQTTDGGSPATIHNYTGDIETTNAGGSGTLLLETTGGNTQPSNTKQKDSSHTLTNNASGLTVSGPGVRAGTKLIVAPLSLDEPGQSAGCDAIRQYILDNDLTVLFGADLSLSRSFSGGLTITIPVGTQYDGQTLTLLHYHNGILETLTAVVVNGQAVFTLSGLSPVALVADTAAVSAATGAAKSLDNIPVTEDRGLVFVWWLLCGVSAAGTALLVVRRRTLSKQ